MTSGGSLAAYQTFSTLFGVEVSLEDIVGALGSVPLDQILGVINLYAINSLRSDREHEDFQRDQLRTLISLLELERSVPAARLSSARHIALTLPLVLVHPHNAAMLTHLALMHSPASKLTPELTPTHQAEVLRLLLKLADHLKEPDRPESSVPLVNEKVFALSLLRAWQFQTDQHPGRAYSRIVRYAQLYLDHLPNVVSDLCIDQVFEAATGVSLQVYFQNVLALATHLFHAQAQVGGAAWMQVEPLTSKMGAGRPAFETLLRRWTTSLEAYRTRYEDIRMGFGSSFAEAFNFVALRETPLIEARPGEFILPVAQFFLEKVATEPFFAILGALPNAQKNQFTVALGAAFERYAARLIESVAKMDCGGPWQMLESVMDGGDELADVYLQRGQVALAFELKALRLTNAFLAGLQDDLILGPTDQTLEDHARTPLSLQEIRSRRNGGDRGLITRGMYQQSMHGSQLLQVAEQRLGTMPELVYPIIAHLADVKIEETVYVGYLRPLIRHLGLYRDRFWEAPNWLHIEDLEALAAVAEAGQLDLEIFLRDKRPETRMDAALAAAFPRKWMAPPDLLVSRMGDLVAGAQADLFGSTPRTR